MSVPSSLPAVVLASFGSTVEEARRVEADFLRATEKRYPGRRVVLANTARKVMAKNAAAGVRIPSLYRALADLADEGHTRVAVQSLHLVPGGEYEGVAAIAEAQRGLPKGLEAVSLGAPLLASNGDCAAVADALVASLPEERTPGHPAVFVGHGTHHGVGGMVYAALQWHLARRDPNAFVGVLEGTPGLEDVLAALPALNGGDSPVWVAPLLGLAGDHAKNDLYGDGEGSWKSSLAARGLTVREASTPLYAVPAIREIWFAHLDAALAALEETG